MIVAQLPVRTLPSADKAFTGRVHLGHVEMWRAIINLFDNIQYYTHYQRTQDITSLSQLEIR